MKTIMNKIVTVITCLLLFGVIAAIINLNNDTIKAVKKLYAENAETLDCINTYLDSERFDEYDVIRIDLFDLTAKIECSKKDEIDGGYKTSVFTENEMVEHLDNLRGKNFVRVLKENNYIYYQTKGTFNKSVGLIFSPNEEPHISEYKTLNQVLEMLNSAGWYYIKTIYDE